MTYESKYKEFQSIVHAAIGGGLHFSDHTWMAKNGVNNSYYQARNANDSVCVRFYWTTGTFAVQVGVGNAYGKNLATTYQLALERDRESFLAPAT